MSHGGYLKMAKVQFHQIQFLAMANGMNPISWADFKEFGDSARCHFSHLS